MSRRNNHASSRRPLPTSVPRTQGCLAQPRARRIDRRAARHHCGSRLFVLFPKSGNRLATRCAHNRLRSCDRESRGYSYPFGTPTMANPKVAVVACGAAVFLLCGPFESIARGAGADRLRSSAAPPSSRRRSPLVRPVPSSPAAPIAAPSTSTWAGRLPSPLRPIGTPGSRARRSHAMSDEMTHPHLEHSHEAAAAARPGG